MTESTHTYTAVILGNPNLALSIKGGSITLDESSAPHVQARLIIPIPAAATLAALDTRLSPPPRIRLTATAVYTTTTEQRVFDLTLRDRDVDHANATVSLMLSSDEALLSDYAPLADDAGAFAAQSSLRAVVNYALGKALPGAALQAGGTDTDVTVYTDASNLVPDPRMTDTAYYPPINCTRNYDTAIPGPLSGVAYNGIRLSAPTAQASCISIVADTGGLRLGMQPGRTYTFSMTGEVISTIGSPGGDARRLVAYYRIGTGAYQSVQSPQVPAAVGSRARVSVTFTVPVGATEAFIRAFHGGTSGAITWGHPRLSETDIRPGADNTEPFSGASPETAGYRYTWDNVANASASKRTALIDRSPEVLLWPAGRDALAFLGPIVQSFGRRLVCDEQRKWTLRDEAFTAAGSLTVRHAVNLIDASDKVSRDDETWFDAAVVVWRWLDRDRVQRTAVDSYALPGATRVRRFEFNRPYPGPGFAAYAVRRAQGRGREVSATSVADWRARAEQPVQIVLNGAPIQSGKSSRVVFDLDRDEMTVLTRSVDTPANAIDLLTGTIDSLTRTIDNL
ncbi:hypothetical protein [Microbacterium testaceum]|uniref:hypothetical protein n=1 Tax=Microbacterium testaceum TaxID=2033 RepID=UPI0022E050A9|nr:hypothetical protein [Microbacterium testaceum]